MISRALTTEIPTEIDLAETASPLPHWDRYAIGLSNAKSLRDITATMSAKDPVDDMLVLLGIILPTLPPDAHLDSCTVLVTRSVDECTKPYAAEEDTDEDEKEEEDDPETDLDLEELAKEWAAEYEYCERSLERVRVASDFITMQLIHPLQWNGDLYQGIHALWSAGIPLRLEHTTVDGAIRTYTPPSHN